MKKRFLEARVKALKEKKDVAKVKVPKKRVAIEKTEADNRKKKKLAFLLPGQVQDHKPHRTEEAKKVEGKEKALVTDRVMVDSINLTEGVRKIA